MICHELRRSICYLICLITWRRHHALNIGNANFRSCITESPEPTETRISRLDGVINITCLPIFIHIAWNKRSRLDPQTKLGLTAGFFVYDFKCLGLAHSPHRAHALGVHTFSNRHGRVQLVPIRSLIDVFHPWRSYSLKAPTIYGGNWFHQLQCFHD